MAQLPIGLHLARTARTVSQAFDRAMAEAGGSVPMWQVLLLIRSKQWGQQSQMAEAMGISSATLTHHLNALAKQGLVTRKRDDANRRIQQVEITDAGIVMFDRLRKVAQAHDKRLRAALDAGQLEQITELLDALAGAVAPAADRS
jgi:MarR family transcriptional regulator for hemolysin